MPQSQNSRIPQRGVPLDMSRIHPEHNDSAPPDLFVAADILTREEPDEDDDEDDDDGNGNGNGKDEEDDDDDEDDDEENDDGYSE
jgi:hypothetical protein